MEGMSKLKSLKILNLGNNLIQKIENLEELTSLLELNLKINQIETIDNLAGNHRIKGSRTPVVEAVPDFQQSLAVSPRSEPVRALPRKQPSLSEPLRLSAHVRAALRVFEAPRWEAL